MEIKTKLTVTRGEVEGDNGGQQRKGCQRTCIKDPWTKPKGVGLRVGGGDGWGGGEHGGVKMETTVLKQQLKKRKYRSHNYIKTKIK